MMDKLNRLSDPNLSKKEEDQIFGEILKTKLDDDLKAKWQGMLSSEHGIERSETNPKKIGLSSNYLKIFLAAAACISVLIVLQLFNTTPSDPQLLAQNYLNEQEILHPGASKGSVDEHRTRVLAIQAFNNKDYVQSAKYFHDLETVNEEDRYYHGLALLLNNHYAKAIQKFEESRANNNRFIQELNWFLAVTYVLNGNNKEAKKLLKSIHAGKWKYKEAQELLRAID